VSVYVVTGKLGSGKTLITVSRIREYIRQGRPVATNLNLNLLEMLGPFNRSALVYRLPDKPCRADLEAIGVVDQKADEDKNGLIVLDECGTWLNSRGWNDPARQPLFEWFVHARKFGWDVIFIVQDISILDKQAREAFAEHVVYCRRLDRLAVPFLSFLSRVLAGVRLVGPKVHMAVVRYGDKENSLVVDRWMYRGTDLYRAYDTRQVFINAPGQLVYCVLPPFFLGRFSGMSRFRYVFNQSRRWFIRRPLVLLVLGAAFAAPAYAMFFQSRQVEPTASVPASATIKTSPGTSAPPKFKQYRIIGGAFSGPDSSMIFEDEDGMQVTSEDLERAGYKVVFFTPCAVSVHTPDRHVYLASCGLPSYKPETVKVAGPLSQFLPSAAP
jgi:Zonular occludens toxin (Zot).